MFRYGNIYEDLESKLRTKTSNVFLPLNIERSRGMRLTSQTKAARMGPISLHRDETWSRSQASHQFWFCDDRSVLLISMTEIDLIKEDARLSKTDLSTTILKTCRRRRM